MHKYIIDKAHLYGKKAILTGAKKKF